MVLTAVRTWVGDPLLVTNPSGSPELARELASGAATLSALSGLGAGFLVALAGIAFGRDLQTALLALAPCLPFLLFQDAARYALLARSGGRGAFLNDSLWLVTSVSLLMALRITNNDSLPLSVLAFGGSVIPSAVLGARQAKLSPSALHLKQWVAEARHLASRISAEFVVYTLSSLTMVTAVIAATASVEAVGFLRSAQTMMGPMSVWFAATTIYMQPAMVRRFTSGGKITRSAISISIANAFAASAWCVAVLLVPRRAGVRIFGASWDGARELLLVIGALFVLSGIASGAGTMLRAERRMRDALLARMATAAVVVPTTISVGIWGSYQQTLAAFAVCTAFATIGLWWVAMHSSIGGRSAPHLSASSRVS